jgi:alpha-glucosidase
VSGSDIPRLDTELGLRRARAAIMLLLALPGSVYLYQGEELGLPEVFDLPPTARQDPIFHRSDGAVLGRDGCRVPLPWTGTTPPYGFGQGAAWLPQPAEWAQLSVAAQREDANSTLNLYRAALRLRRNWPGRHSGDLVWRSAPGDDLLVLERPGLLCAINLGSAGAAVSTVEPLLASSRLDGDRLPPDTAAWFPTSTKQR